ncbi:5-(carboxyamino)imidazole ribonucleotide synthase [Pirellulimonas nuda]|nr:5-(carboxyamino)imidazole ribonucleotide synthase [Pirellulimonas nuda]
MPHTSTLGVFGGGQLGRMFCQAASALGYQTHVFAPEAGCPASQVADSHTQADYHDFAEVEAFARSVAAATLEFENVPVATVEAAGRHCPVRPSGEALFTVQNRGREKRFLIGVGVECAPFAMVRSNDELQAAIAQIGAPAVLKTTQFGYDGKGQTMVRDASQASDAWAYLGRHKCVLEGFVSFRRELSVVVARDSQGATSVCGPIENEHANHILDLSVYPASCSPATAAEARRVAVRVAHELDVVGVMCVEFFETEDGRVLVNEVAPRPHNSGHLTIEASPASQFEQQARTLAGLPLGDFTPRGPAAMANLLGDLWSEGEPNWDRATALGATVHLYGKTNPKPGRKMGHLTVQAGSPEEARTQAIAARSSLHSA